MDTRQPTPSSESGVTVRGSLFFGLREIIRRNYCAEYEAILDTLEPNHRRIASGVLTASCTYPIESYWGFLEGFHKRVSPEVFSESARKLVESDLRGIYLLVARQLSREYLLENASKVFRHAYSHGDLTVVANLRNSQTVRVSSLRMPPAHVAQLEAYIRHLLDRTTKQQHRSTSRSLNETTHEFVMNW